MLQRAADLIGATVVAKQFHRFKPWGLSGVMLIEESHISVHTWPEHRCACVDIFTCSEEMDPTPALDYLREAFGAEEIDVQEIPAWPSRCHHRAGETGRVGPVPPLPHRGRGSG